MVYSRSQPLEARHHGRPAILDEWETEQELLKDALESELIQANLIKEKIDSFKFTVKHKVGANGHLIGSVTNKEIQQVMMEQADIDIDKKQISVKSKIKTIGIFEVDCKLGHGIHALAKIDVMEDIICLMLQRYLPIKARMGKQ